MRGGFGGWGGLYLPLNTRLYTRVGKGTEDSVHDSTHNRGGHKQSYNGGRRSGLMVSVLDSGASGRGLSPGQGHYVVLLGKTLDSHSASLHPGV